jgi:hypothetical protein
MPVSLSERRIERALTSTEIRNGNHAQMRKRVRRLEPCTHMHTTIDEQEQVQAQPVSPISSRANLVRWMEGLTLVVEGQ